MMPCGISGRIGGYIKACCAKYGINLLDNLSKDLTLRHGRGFSRSTLNYMRLFYLLFPNYETLSHNLSWSHYCELVKTDNELERGFYYQQNIIENWSVRELRRQKDSGSFLRFAASKNKEKVLELARKGQTIVTVKYPPSGPKREGGHNVP
ncbi:MAG: DUF1016 N-terminal domain-containing protein [Treponema sp.]|jgi:hypothetical protein|nr:DUF1016 N-terminal domain-containing protein [Treponema sp.]